MVPIGVGLSGAHHLWLGDHLTMSIKTLQRNCSGAARKKEKLTQNYEHIYVSDAAPEIDSRDFFFCHICLNGSRGSHSKVVCEWLPAEAGCCTQLTSGEQRSHVPSARKWVGCGRRAPTQGNPKCQSNNKKDVETSSSNHVQLTIWLLSTHDNTCSNKHANVKSFRSATLKEHGPHIQCMNM